MGLVKTLLDSLHHQYIPGRTSKIFDSHIVAVHAYPKIIFIMKGLNADALSKNEQMFISAAVAD